MIPQRIQGIGNKLDAFETALIAACPTTWTIEQGFVPYTERPDIILESVVLNIICEGEGEYSTVKGMAGREGTLSIHLVAHLKVDEFQTREELQQAEIEVMEILKEFTRAGVAGVDIKLMEQQQSRMLEHPYGWVIAFFQIRPPGANTL